MEIFTDKKTTFEQKYFGNFDTPKKLNRSAKDIPANFIELVESGEITSAEIKKIGASFPIFTYYSCLTIHGNMPKIERTRVGEYKNIIQNKNGSLEIRWSAIDYKAKKDIASYLRFSENWRTLQNSTNGIYFEKTKIAKTVQEANEILTQERENIKALTIPNSTAKIFVQGYSYFGRYYIITTILPYAITGEPVKIASIISGISECELKAKVDEQTKEAKEREAHLNLLKQKQEEAKQTAVKAVSHLQTVSISDKIGSIYVIPTVNLNSLPAFRFYRIDKKGTFGRFEVSTYILNKLELRQELFAPHMKGKQVKLSELTTKQAYLFKA